LRIGITLCGTISVTFLIVGANDFGFLIGFGCNRFRCVSVQGSGLIRDIPLSGGLSGNISPSLRLASHSENLMNSMPVFSEGQCKNKKEHTFTMY
jgi:hypothetical protein